MRRTAALIAGLLCLAAAALLGALAFSRARLPYNEEGRYFDAADSVVLDESAILVSALLAAAFAVAGLALLALRRR